MCAGWSSSYFVIFFFFQKHKKVIIKQNKSKYEKGAVIINQTVTALV